jgi:hypothetical protein
MTAEVQETLGHMSDVPTAWIVDIDGTLALRGDRGPYDWEYVGRDLPNAAVVMTVQALATHPNVTAILAITGRHESARQQTVMWLDAQGVPFDELLMRPDWDHRPDEVVKEETYRSQIAPRFAIIGVIDDREKIVRMWRGLGLICFQVAEGRF